MLRVKKIEGRRFQWTYRVMRTLGCDGVAFYGLHRVFLGENGEMLGWEDHPIGILFDSVEELEDHVREQEAGLGYGVIDSETGEPLPS